MGSLFSTKSKQSKSRITEQDKAILQLKQQRDRLKQYQKKISIQLEKDRDVARQLLKDGKKDKAKLLLRKKKLQESLLSKTDNQLDNIEKMVEDIEFAQIENQVVNGLKVGNDSLKKMHELLSLEDVEKIMDETRDGIAYQQEIDTLLSGALSSEDEDDVLKELEQIVKSDEIKITEEDLPNVPDEPLEDAAIKDERKKERVHREPVLAT